MATGTIQKSINYDILYDTGFQTGSVTLKKSIANYKYIEVNYGKNVFRVKNNYKSSVGMSIGCWGQDFSNSSNLAMIFSLIACSISGATFTINDHSRMYFYQDFTKPIIDKTAFEYVYEIRGYYY